MKDKEQRFWNKEYKDGSHLSLSDNPSEELVLFCKWIEKELGEGALSYMDVLDVGCGNGRNLIYIAKNFGVKKGYGYDISVEAINLAKKESKELKGLEFEVGDIRDTIKQESGSVDLVLDLMVSHHLTKDEHKKYLQELFRVMKSESWLLWKTFLRDDDMHAKKMIRDSKARGLGKDDNGYIHPEFGFYEYVWSEDELREYVEPYFKIHTLRRSQTHKGGRAFNKRRYMVAYLERK